MLKGLMVVIAAVAVIGYPAAFAADQSSAADESSSVSSASTVPSQTQPANMCKPSETPESFIAPEDWEADGEVIAALKEFESIAQGDTVFVNVGSDDAVAPGTRCIIYRKGEEVDDAGTMVKAIGELEIVGGIREKSATARILYSHDVVAIGDMVEIE